MITEQVEDEVADATYEDTVAYIIREVLPLLADAGNRGMTRPSMRTLLAEVDRLCEEYGPL